MFGSQDQIARIVAARRRALRVRQRESERVLSDISLHAKAYRRVRFGREADDLEGTVENGTDLSKFETCSRREVE